MLLNSNLTLKRYTIPITNVIVPATGYTTKEIDLSTFIESDEHVYCVDGYAISGSVYSHMLGIYTRGNKLIFSVSNVYSTQTTLVINVVILVGKKSVSDIYWFI